MRAREIFETVNTKLPVLPWQGNPDIGWWPEKKPLTLYHGTHKDRVADIANSALAAPKSGPTAGWVSLALEPNTAFGYASMHGGESAFRAAGARAEHVPPKERAVLVLEFPNGVDDLESMGLDKQFRGNTPDVKERLLNKEKYDEWNKSDQEYYQLAELRVPNKIPAKYIKGVMFKG